LIIDVESTGCGGFASAWSRRLCGFLLALALVAGIGCPGAEARQLRTVGVIVADLDNPFFAQVGESIEEAAKRLIGPDVTVTVRSSGYDLDRQIQQIDEFIAQGTDLLFINAVDTQNIGAAVARARQAGIVVVAVDVRANGAQATVTSDNGAAGRMACDYLARRLGGKGDVLILNGPPVSSVLERVRGCKAELARFPDIRVLPDDEDCGGSLEGGLSHMTDMLTKYPRLGAAFAINDPTAIGADIAAARARRTEFFIVSVDGSPLGAETLGQPGTRLAATVAQSPRVMAEKAVAFGIDLFSGRSLDRDTVEIPVNLLTSENISAYAGWGAKATTAPAGQENAGAK